MTHYHPVMPAQRSPGESRQRPSAESRFGWHPEPGLIGVDEEPTARVALERLGAAAWQTALDYLFGEAFRQSTGGPTDYLDLRRTFYGPAGGPGPAPHDPTPSAELLAEFTTRLAPYQLNSWHPRTLSYFTPPPLTMSIVGELLAQFTNQGVDVWHAGPSSAFVEEEVGRWLCDLVGYGPESFGILTSGGVMANLMAMTVARDIHLRRILGLSEPPRGRHLDGVRAYASEQTHFSIARALDELGFPPDTLHLVPADDDFRLRGEPVARAIAEDRAAGLTPWAISAVAGSTNTGSVDRTEELAAVARREGLWLHVDAAYGGGALLSERDRPRLPGMEQADSVTIDPHKWFFQAYDIGGLLVRQGDHLVEVYHHSPEYYRGGEAPADATPADGIGADGEPLNYYQRSLEGTRRWRALKLWMSWKHLGTVGLGRLVEANNDLAGYLARACAAADDFEALPAEPELSVVCFRHLPGGAAAAARMEPADLDAHQDRIQAALVASGDGWVGTTRLRDATWLRAGIVNYLTTEADIDRILDDLRRIARD
ncbi:MAG: aromatic-L-amino-acid/L-tryptophan decarboxylase [Chloroflexota bacterium]|nr:aromatic-L-amino-acid/L-tryptophan decarboxylase [Chloroflexota bacterium]